MKPNLSAAAALGRALFVLGVSTFFGALVLPLAADGTLPTTWMAWRPVLAVAGSASVAAEILWIRTHLNQTAQALGILSSLTPGTPPPPPAPSVVAAAVKAGAVLALGLLLTGCAALMHAAPPAIATVQCVISDAGKGDNISQIVTDCGGDVAQVVAVLVNPANYAAVSPTSAYAEAGRVKLALAVTP